MARSNLTSPTDDLISDSGAVLWSIVRGEQLEFPINLNFVEDITAGYVYEAVIVEALNIDGEATRPTAIRPGGVVTNLVVRVPTNRGNWQAIQAYNREEVVTYDSVVYKLKNGAGRVSAITPDLDPMWEVANLNRVYLQFPKTLTATWTVMPSVETPAYGFFELRVTEPTDAIFSRTWKPVRGMLQVLFSPTYSVDD